MKTDKMWQVFFLFIAGLFLICLQLIQRAEFMEIQFLGKEATATVVDIYSGYRMAARTVVEFDANGQHIRAELRNINIGQSLEIGQRVQVLYHPQDNYKVIPLGARLPWLLFFIGGALLLIGILAIFLY